MRPVTEQFQWLRNGLIVYAAGNHYLESYEILRLKGRLVIWFTRDESGNLMLNVQPPLGTVEPRLVMEENFWLVHGNQEDLDCPPSGRLVHAKYANGDELKIEFAEFLDEGDIRKHYRAALPKVFEVETPITAVEVTRR